MATSDAGAEDSEDGAQLDERDLALIDAQLARTPEDRLRASHELARLRPEARRHGDVVAPPD